MLFLLTDEKGRALLIAAADNKTQADSFGHNHLPQFCGDSIEIDATCLQDAEEFWNVRTVRLVNKRLDPERRATRTAVMEPKRPVSFTIRHCWIQGPELPPEILDETMLPAEDRSALAIDHIERTSQFVTKIEIVKWAKAEA